MAQGFWLCNHRLSKQLFRSRHPCGLVSQIPALHLPGIQRHREAFDLKCALNFGRRAPHSWTAPGCSLILGVGYAIQPWSLLSQAHPHTPSNTKDSPGPDTARREMPTVFSLSQTLLHTPFPQSRTKLPWAQTVTSIFRLLKLSLGAEAP